MEIFLVIWKRKFLIAFFAFSFGFVGFLYGTYRPSPPSSYVGMVTIEISRYVDNQGRIVPLENVFDLAEVLRQKSAVKAALQSDTLSRVATAVPPGAQALIELRVFHPEETSAKAELEYLIDFIKERHEKFVTRLGLPESRYLVGTEPVTVPTYKLNKIVRDSRELIAVAFLCLGGMLGVVLVFLLRAIDRRKAILNGS